MKWLPSICANSATGLGLHQLRIAFLLALSLFAGHSAAYAQAQPAPLDPATIQAVDRLYPGFTEILEQDDAEGLVKLARTLTAQPSPEAVHVLLWMLRNNPSWPQSDLRRIDDAIRKAGWLPLALIADALLHGAPDHRQTAAFLLASHWKLIPQSDHPQLDKTLMAALADTSDRVRDAVVAALRARGSPEALAAVHEYMERSGQADTGPRPPIAVPAFPAETAALLASIDIEYRNTLSTQDEPAVRRLLEALQRTPRAPGTPALVWLLANGDTAHGGNVVYQLSQQEHALRLPFGELAGMLRRAEPRRKVLIAELLKNVFGTRTQAMSTADRKRIIAALIECLDGPSASLATEAVEALGRLRAAEAVGPIVRLLNVPVGEYERTTRVHALGAIGTPEAVRVLERLARSGASYTVREAAAVAYIYATSPADPGTQARRLLWEQPDTALERRVMAEGAAALPDAWSALRSRSANERRAAAALLGWYRNTGSIAPILGALDAAPGALTREQLLFDLNMILLTEAPPAPPADRNALAALHLRWLYDQLIGRHSDSHIRGAVLPQKILHVFPDRIAAPFSATLGTATASLAPSPEAFLRAVGSTGVGVAFHAITAANGVARVATTVYLPKGGISNQVWISLYRRQENRWAALPVPSHAVLRSFSTMPNLVPTIQRNYGPDHPLKLLRLDLTMERIRVDRQPREYLHNENLDNPGHALEVDGSYVPLLDRYKRADSPAVQYTAEVVSARLTKQPDLQVWIDALSRHAGTPIQQLAARVLGEYVPPRFKSGGRELMAIERADLIAAALTSAAAADRALVPRPLPSAGDVRNVRQWSRFGLVDLVVGSGPRGQSGYAMLFERRADRWVFLCVVSGWIS
jgi:HEAT repeat protein